MAENFGLDNNFLEVRRSMAKALVERHSGHYIVTEPPENHLLPYEITLRNRESEWFHKLNPCDFLHKQKDDATRVTLNTKILISACEDFFQNTYEGTDYYKSVIKTLRRHIKKITDQKLTDWLKGEHSQDAIKTTYLLYQLHICTPSGIEILANEKDSRYVSVELFSARHQSLNKKITIEEDNVVLLSSWLKELFVKATFHCDMKYRAVLKNLDLIHSGYLGLYAYLLQEPDESLRSQLIEALFPIDILNRDNPAKETLSITLMRKWQLQRSIINRKAIDELAIKDPLVSAIDGNLLPEHSLPHLKIKQVETIRNGAAFLTYYMYAMEYRNLTKNLTEEEFKIFVEKIKRLEPKIFQLLASDAANKIKVVAKGISTDSKQTSLFNTLNNYFQQNINITTSHWGTDKTLVPPIKLDNGCDAHLTYFSLRIFHAVCMPELTGKDYLNKIIQDQNNKDSFNHMVRRYISNLSVPEIFNDMERVNKIMSEYTGSIYKILPNAPECT